MSALKTACFFLLVTLLATPICTEVCPPVPTTAPGVFVLNVTVDQTLFALFIDDLPYTDLPNFNNYVKVDTVELPDNARLIAVHGQHSLSHAGLIASVSNGYATTNNKTWKCNAFSGESPPDDWMNLGYNDSDWLNAVAIGVHGDPNLDFDWGCVDGIAPDAVWIWTQSSVTPAEDRHVYCRGYLPLCDVIQPCLNGATCFDNSPELCLCAANYTGVFCETDLDPCRSDPCKNGGTCVGSPNYFTCTCPPNYTGTQCETYINVCDSNPCQHDGTCVDEGGSFYCLCIEYASGVLCETYMDACVEKPCLNGGTCNNFGTAYNCTCPPFYTGPMCETEIIYDCGDILHDATNATIPEGWHLGCYIGEGDEAFWSTPCWALLQGLSYYGSSEALLAAGGDFGCWASPEPSADVYNACYPDYQQDLVLAECSVCKLLTVCIQFPTKAQRLQYQRGLLRRPAPHPFRRRLH